MPQTLLALLALVFASFLTFNQQRFTLQSQTNLVTDEIELAAAGVASEVMALVEAKSFDEQSTPEAIYDAQEVPSSASDFSPILQLGPYDRGSAGCSYSAPRDTPDCDDVDDVSALGWQPYTIELAREVVRDENGVPVTPAEVYVRELEFEIRIYAYYVSNPESMAFSALRTLHKRIVLDVRSPFVPGDDDGLVRLTRVVSYDPVKAEMDYENTDGYGPIGNEEGPGGGTTTEETPE